MQGFTWLRIHACSPKLEPRVLQVFAQRFTTMHNRRMSVFRETDSLRPEYEREDLGRGARGVHYHSCCEGSNLVLLSPDVAAAFPTERAVTEALRSLMNASGQLEPGATARKDRGT
jgi:hypothetical protein